MKELETTFIKFEKKKYDTSVELFYLAVSSEFFCCSVGIYKHLHSHIFDLCFADSNAKFQPEKSPSEILTDDDESRFAEKKQPSSLSPSHPSKARSEEESFVRTATETGDLCKSKSKTVYISPGDTRIGVQQSLDNLIRQSALTRHSGNQPQEPVHPDPYQNKENEAQTSTKVSPGPWKQTGQRNNKSQEKASGSKEQTVSRINASKNCIPFGWKKR